MRSHDDPWGAALDAAIPALLSHADRDARSPTYGLFDRRYWAWSFSDMPAPRAQEAVLPLAVAYQGGAYRGRAELRAWIGAGIDAWARLAHADGSLDEAYPSERSWGATAFTACAVAETLELVGAELEPAVRARGIEALARAARFLADHEETHGTLSNHLAAGAAALALARRLTGETAFDAAADLLFDRISRAASPEGGLREYAGVDPGYQSHALGYLAIYAGERAPSHTTPLLSRAVELLAWTMGPDGALAGEIGSRDTAFFFPSGVERLAASLPLAGALASRARAAVRGRRVPGLGEMDAPNWIPMLASYARAHRAWRALDDVSALPADGEGERWMPGAGLLARNTARYHALVAADKGGVVSALGRDGTSFVASGWATGDATSQWMGAEVEAPQDGVIRVVTPFRVRRDRAPGVGEHLGLRLASTTLGRTALGARAIKGLLVHRLVDREVRAPLRLDRTILLSRDAIEIRDRVTWEDERPADLAPVERITSIHMGSARYFQPRELAPRAPTTTAEREGPGWLERTTRAAFSG